MANESKDVLLVYFSGSGSTKAVSELLRRKLAEIDFKVTLVDLSISTKAEVIDGFQLIVLGIGSMGVRGPAYLIPSADISLIQSSNMMK